MSFPSIRKRGDFTLAFKVSQLLLTSHSYRLAKFTMATAARVSKGSK